MQISRPYTVLAFLLCSLLQLMVKPALSQTSGAGYVTSIEAKARQILALEAEIEELKQKISRLNLQKQESIDNAKKRLADAIEHTKNDASWKNRLNTAKSGWQEKSPGTCSAGGPPPICSADHWFATSVSAAMNKYNEYLDNYLQPFRDAVADAGKSEQQAMDRAGRDIDRKNAELPDLRKQMISLSKQYEDHIKETAEKKAKSYGMELVKLLSEVHYQEDLVAQYSKQIDDNKAKEAARKNEVTEKVKSQMQALKKKLEQDIQLLDNRCKQEVASHEAGIRQHNAVIADLQAKIREVEKNIQSYKGPETQKLAYEEQKSDLQRSMYAEQNKVSALTDAIKQLKDQLFQETSMLRSELLKLTSDEGSKIEEARKLVEEAFASQRELLLKGKNNAEAGFITNTRAYRQKLDEREKEYYKWVSVVDGERVRVMRACQSVSCSCYGTYVVNEANMIWNNTRECLGSLDRMRKSNGAVLYSNCVAFKTYYDSLYKGYQGNNNAAEQEALDKQKALNRFENLSDN